MEIWVKIQPNITLYPFKIIRKLRNQINTRNGKNRHHMPPEGLQREHHCCQMSSSESKETSDKPKLRGILKSNWHSKMPKLKKKKKERERKAYGRF